MRTTTPDKILYALVLFSALVCGGSSCGGGGGGGGGGPQPTPDTTKPSITKAEYTPMNPIIGQPFQANITATDDTTNASELEVEVTLDGNKNGFADDTPVTATDSTLPVTITLGNIVNGTYQVQVKVKDKAGNQAAQTYTIITNPHDEYNNITAKFVKQGTVVEDPGIASKNRGELLGYAARYFNNIGFNSGSSNHFSDLSRVINDLTSDETLANFDVDTAGKVLRLFVNYKGSNYADNGSDPDGDWGGDVDLSQIVLDDLTKYLTEVLKIHPTPSQNEVVQHAGYYFNFNPAQPNIAVNNNYTPLPQGFIPANPDIDTAYLNPFNVVLPGTGTLQPDPANKTIFVIDYKPVNNTALTKVVVINPSSVDKALIAQFTGSANYDPATYRVDVLEGAGVTKAKLDRVLNNP